VPWREGPASISESLGPDLFGDPSTSHLVITLLQVFVARVLATGIGQVVKVLATATANARS
jgi:hypothetical protein